MTKLYTEKTVRDIINGFAVGLRATAESVQKQADDSEDIGSAILLDGTAKGLDMAALIIEKSGVVVLERLADGESTDG